MNNSLMLVFLLKHNALDLCMKKLLIMLLFVTKMASAQHTVIGFTPEGDTIYVAKYKPPAATTAMTSFSNLSNINLSITKQTYTGKYILTNLQNVTIDFNGSIFDSPTRVLELHGAIKNVTLKNLDVRNTVNDYAIVYPDTTSGINGLTISNLTARNTNQVFHANGSLTTGIVRNFTFAGNTIRNCPVLSSAVEIRNCWGCNITGNVVDSVNMANNNHNGVFFFIGSGTIAGNTLSNAQGTLGRVWPMSHTSVRETVTLSGNIDFNNRKYSAFELQATTQNLGGKFYPADCVVTGNNAYNLGLDAQSGVTIDCQMLDLYQTGGNVAYSTNTGANMRTYNTYRGITDMVNNLGGTLTINTNNTYKK